MLSVSEFHAQNKFICGAFRLSAKVRTSKQHRLSFVLAKKSNSQEELGGAVQVIPNVWWWSFHNIQ